MTQSQDIAKNSAKKISDIGLEEYKKMIYKILRTMTYSHFEATSIMGASEEIILKYWADGSAPLVTVATII